MGEILSTSDFRNIHTDYEVGDWFTFGYTHVSIEKIRKDEDGYNEYLMSDGEWYSGWKVTFCCD